MTNDNPNDNRNSYPKRPEGGKPPVKAPRNLYGWMLLFMLIATVFTIFNHGAYRQNEINFSDFRTHVLNGDVQSVIIKDTAILGTFKPDYVKQSGDQKDGEFTVTIVPSVIDREALQKLVEAHVPEYKYQYPSAFYDFLITLVPWVLIIALMYFLIFRQFRGAGGAGMLGNFGRSRHRMSSKEQNKVTFADVAGIDEAKEEVQEIIQFLRNPKKFQRLGGRIPRGVLLVGEPGCGKTLLAKAIAGEADVPFFSISGSDFVEMFVGVGASRVRDLFKQAKDNAPCIIFLDEIDAVGRKRGSGIAGGGHDEREQTLNAILVEMDGFSSSDQVIVIAATNRADVLDHALTRPGRFDRQIYVPLPDIKGRMEILKVHAQKIKLSPKADLKRLAQVTPMFSGADLEAIINEAALAATMQNKDCVEMVDLEEARDKVRWGRARRSRVIDDKDKDIVAYHEAGHALVQALQSDADPVHKVSIIPRGQMGGATFSLPEKDRIVYSRAFCLAEIRVCFGGRVAEEIACGDISNGAGMDIRQATGIARRMIMNWGMSEKIGFIYYGPNDEQPWFGELPGSREYSEATALLIDQEVKTIIDQAYHEVKKIITDNRDKLEAIKQALLKYETLDGDEVKQIIAGQVLDKATISDLLKLEQKRSSGSENAAEGDNAGSETPTDAEKS